MTGVALLQQRLMSVAGEPVPLGLWITTLGGLAIFVLLRAVWASAQFRENVLFRDAERVGLVSLARGLFVARLKTRACLAPYFDLISIRPDHCFPLTRFGSLSSQGVEQMRRFIVVVAFAIAIAVGGYMWFFKQRS